MTSRGKDAGSVHTEVWTRLRTPHHGVQRRIATWTLIALGALHCRAPRLPFVTDVPIYEYRCPNGHTFELFQKMSDASPEACPTCGKGPVEKILFPVAVHFKGSGFYSTDYGRGGKKAAAKDGGEERRRHREVGGEAGREDDEREEDRPTRDHVA